jgi:hypothetical protein
MQLANRFRAPVMARATRHLSVKVHASAAHALVSKHIADNKVGPRPPPPPHGVAL